MKTPSFPSNEAVRLAELHAYEILDTAAEASFDALTALAAAVLDVPIALVTLVDVDRQWFKSRYGLGASEVPREVSFCGHVVADGAPMVVRDALADARFADNPMVVGHPRVRFYAGVPLRTSAGVDVGTLCAIDHVPRDITPKQLELLTVLADLAVRNLEAHKTQSQLMADRTTAVKEAAYLKVLFEAMVEGVVVQGRDGVITSSNRSAERILGLSVKQLEGRSSLDPAWRSVHENGQPFTGEHHPAMVTLRTGAPTRDVIMGVHKPGGELAWISINAFPLQPDRDGLPGAVISTFHDVTALKAGQVASERLARQEYLVTTGTLASGVGHEINNPLSYVLANVEFAMDELRSIAGGSPSARMREIIEVLTEARGGAERIRRIVHGLRALARHESASGAMQVAGAVAISVNMSAHETRPKATVLSDLAVTPLVFADESRLSQVLVNLIVNAAQSFATGDVEKNRIIISSAVEPDGRVSVAVSDNGPGIPLDLQQRIFDPFFTTKPSGEGTGLGLAICRSIVASLGGELILLSRVGRGSTFSVLLPTATVPLDVASAPSEPPPEGRGASVLVVDDEVALVKIFRRVLTTAHRVVGHTDAREALRLIEGGERYDVVFCDLIMPHLSGAAFYEAVRAIDVAQADRFVFMSGGGTDARVNAFLADAPNERLDKPVSAQNINGIARRFAGASTAETSARGQV